MKDILLLMRPRHWVKNLMLFFPSFLGGHMLEAGFWQGGRFLVPFAAFCLASSSTYIFNDLVDVECDRNHPQKRQRPLPSGRVSRGVAMLACGALLALAAWLSVDVSMKFTGYLFVYVAIVAFYSLWLKHIPVLDLFCISSGFLLRLFAGGEAFATEVSDWLFLSVFLLSIFLSAGKRIGEAGLLGEAAQLHRKALEKYPAFFLVGTMYVSAAAVLITYTMYLISKPASVFSVPLCMFGLLRYTYRVQCGLSGDPTDALLKDLPLLVTSVVWVALTGWSVYG